MRRTSGRPPLGDASGAYIFLKRRAGYPLRDRPRSIRPTILRTADHDSRLGLLGLVMPHPGTPEELVMPHLGTPEEPVMPHLGPRGYRARATVSLTFAVD